MACSSCGDAVAPKCDKNFTETVVKINNPSKIILFRKVVIPASMGDEKTLPPIVGKYRNVLLQYEATNALYLYSSDGIPTQISVDVSELVRRINELGIKLRIETEERIAGDEALSERIDSLSSSLSDETAARQAADATLQDNIDDETSARIAGDASLSADIVAEAQARANADTALGGRIDNVISDLSAETTARQNADTVLQGNIDNEASARQEADTTLQTNIDTVSNNLATEISNRQNADTTLQNNINAEASARTSADTALNNAIAAEATARQGADNNLQSQIDSIVASSDVKDIVGTHAELEDYDTSTLGNNDIIKVLQDETQDDATTYYRWSTSTETFSLIGSEGPYYTKSQTNTLLDEKQDNLTAGTNVQIVNNTISATDTTYTAGAGLDLSGTEFSIDNTVALKSEIPTVNNATLTIQKNGTTVQTFTANSSSNKTANITVPTNNNELTNGAGYQTAADVQTAIAGKQDTLTAGNAIDITNNVISAAVYPEDYFTNENATVSGTGTDIELEGTAELPMKKIDLLGDTTQQTYSGKNLISLKDATATKNGVTITSSSNGEVSFSGTATASTEVYLSINTLSLAAGTYTTSVNNSNTTDGWMDLSTSSYAWSFATYLNGGTKTDTIAAGTSYTYIVFRIVNGVNYSGLVVKPMIEAGSSATSFEPFVGGIASPSPSYPQPVNNVTGIQTIELSDGMGNSKDYTVELTATKNVFNSPIEVNGISGSGTAQNRTNRANSTEFTYVSPGATYTLNMKPKTSGKTAQGIIRVWDKNGNWVTSLPSDAWYPFPFTVTMPSNAYKVKLSLRYSDDTDFGTVGDLTDAFEDIQLERGATATEYQPFESIELCKIGDYQDYIYKSGDDWYVHKEIGKILFDGTKDFTVLADGPNGIKRFSYSNTSIANVNLSSLGVMCNEYRGISFDSGGGSSNAIPNTMALWNSSNTLIINTSSTTYSVSDFKTFLSTHPALTYYAVATPTEIRITNESLLSQLDALASATTYPDRTMITVSSDNTKVILNASAFTRSYSGTIEAINTKGSGNANVNVGYGLEKSGSTVSVDTDEIATKDDLDSYLPLSGGAITGAITRSLGSGVISNTNVFSLRGSTDGFDVDYEAATSDIGITRIASADDANAQLSLGNKVGSNYKEAINITNGVATINGNSSTATKLATARTIGLGTGANGTATSFDGSANITIPVTDVKESYLVWGGKNHLDGDMTPGVMGCIDEFGHNKFAFLPAKQTKIAFSRDGGSTWLDYTTGNGANETVSDENKIVLVTYGGHNLYPGGRTTGTNTTADDRLRIRIHNLDGTSNKIYTDIKSILIYASSEGSSGMKVQVRHRTIANYQNDVETWTTVGTYDLGGWGGWNSIPYVYRFGGGSTQTGNLGEIELVFWATSRASTNKNMLINGLRFVGSNAWQTPSEMAKTGRLYTIDAFQNATFPANVKVNGSLQHSSYTYTLPSKSGTLATITMTDTDPGEGAAIADGEFIAVYT